MSEAVLERRGSVAAGIGRRPAGPWWLDLPALGGWTFGFVLVVVLGLSGGGYDAVVRGEAGIAAWWVAAAGVATGALALPRRGLVWAALALFVALTAWTAIGLTWTDSTERTVAEVARVTGYLGMLLLAVLVARRTPLRHLVAGLASGLAVVCLYAVSTRLHPDWFASSALDELFPLARRRLAQPVGYWNALAGLLAVGLPLLLAFATDARRVLVRAAAGAVLPVLVLALFLTVSRGGVVAAGAALLVWFALAPDRLPKLGVLAAVAGGSVLLCLAAGDRDALQAGLDSGLAEREGDELTRLVVLTMAGVGALVASIGLLDRHATRPAWTRVPRRAAVPATAALAVALAAAFAAGGGPGWAGDRFDEFKGQSASPGAVSFDNSLSRLGSVEGNGRWQYWVALRDAQREKPLTGIGPGTFEYLWARKENAAYTGGFVRDGHSLWAESLGELGLVGLALVAGFFVLALVAGAARALRSADREHRAALAAATAGVAAFCVIASLEWAWEMTVLGGTGIVLAGLCVAGRADPALGDRGPGPASGLLARAGVVVAALVAVVVIAQPTATTADVRDSQAAIRAGDLPSAYREARAASAADPFSATALLQEALVLERAGELERARAVAVRATAEEPVDWRTWLIRSRLDARLGDAPGSLAAYRRARSLNPNSPLFAR